MTKLNAEKMCFADHGSFKFFVVICTVHLVSTTLVQVIEIARLSQAEVLCKVTYNYINRRSYNFTLQLIHASQQKVSASSAFIPPPTFISVEVDSSRPHT